MHLVKPRQIQNQNLVDRLEELVILARTGEIDGAVFVVRFQDDDYRAGRAGFIKCSQAGALLATCKLKTYLTGEPPNEFY